MLPIPLDRATRAARSALASTRERQVLVSRDVLEVLLHAAERPVHATTTATTNISTREEKDNGEEAG